ncbi:MAG: hypothetical protein GY845_17485 [Planctomycetes bacterium]|nr:hypothetical protein [Planctomycetota bacterium]
MEFDDDLRNSDAGVLSGRGAIEICCNCKKAKFYCSHGNRPIIIDGHCSFHTLKKDICHQDLLDEYNNDDGLRKSMAMCGNCQEFYVTCGNSRRNIESDSYCPQFDIAKRLANQSETTR